MVFDEQPGIPRGGGAAECGVDSTDARAAQKEVLPLRVGEILLGRVRAAAGLLQGWPGPHGARSRVSIGAPRGERAGIRPRPSRRSLVESYYLVVRLFINRHRLVSFAC